MTDRQEQPMSNELAIPDVHDPALPTGEALQHVGDLRLVAKAADALGAAVEAYETYADSPDEDRAGWLRRRLTLPDPAYTDLRQELIGSGVISRDTVPHWPADEW